MYLHTKFKVNITIQYKDMGKNRFRIHVAVGLESDLDQRLISSSPLMVDSCCKTRLKYLDWFLRYFGKIFPKFSLIPCFCEYC